MNNEIKFYINNRTFYAPKRQCTVLEACDLAGVEVPRFCFHERLAIAGNCRMCLVEVEKSPKPIASCAMPLTAEMKIFTDSALTKRARENVMEFLLSNHPLDCPICDQGGECDLQDQALIFGGDRGRFHEIKRSVENKYCGPFVKTVMTRCIHCTRCIRFLAETAGTAEFGTTGRGVLTEVGNYFEKSLTSEFSASITDLCPVGALTSKPYAFTARPWELLRINSVDVFDAFISRIQLDVRGGRVMRVLPLFDEHLDETLISDKTRYAPVEMHQQRLLAPALRHKASGKLKQLAWKGVLAHLRSILDVAKVSFTTGAYNGLEALLAAKNTFASLGAIKPKGTPFDVLSQLVCAADFSKLHDFCLLLGVNTRLEAPLLNLKLRRAVYRQGLSVFALLPDSLRLNYFVRNFGFCSSTFAAIAEGRHWICRKLTRDHCGRIFVGYDTLSVRADAANWFQGLNKLHLLLTRFSKHWHHFEFLYSNSTTLNLLAAGLPFNDRAAENIWALNGSKRNAAFLVQQNHHITPAKVDVALPVATHLETTSFYITNFGALRTTKAAIKPPAACRSNLSILRALLEFLFGNSFNASLNVKNLFDGILSRELTANPFLISEVAANTVVCNSRFELMNESYWTSTQYESNSTLLTAAKINSSRKDTNFKQWEY